MRAVIILILVGVLLLAVVGVLALRGLETSPQVTIAPPPQTLSTQTEPAVTPPPSISTASPSAQKNVMNISSTAFVNNGMIPAKYTCSGVGVSPPLSFSNIPAGTVSLALSVRDPDAPNGTFTHWLVWNLNPKTTKIAEKGVLTGATQGTNDAGKVGYTPPCPPPASTAQRGESGTHHYIFTVYALDSKINLTRDATYPEFQKALQGHVLGQGELIGLYSR